MTSVVVLADVAAPPPHVSGDRVLRLFTSGVAANLRLELGVFETALPNPIPPRLDDLLRIAGYVYGADTRISRGGRFDVWAELWSRSLTMVVPVQDLSFWQAADNREMLTDLLGYLTGDAFTFEFVPYTDTGRSSPQLRLEFDGASRPAPIDSVVMFSGGADSLAAAIDAAARGRRPLLVSHQPVSRIESRQTNLAALVRSRFRQWSFPHVSMCVNRRDVEGRGVYEPTQRSRSFLFTSLGVVAACQSGVPEVRICDNGVVSLNLPQSDQSYGTFLSRSTHPKYLAMAEEFFRRVTDQASLTLTNTLLFRTKREVMEIIADSGHPDLIQETVSCAHTEGRTNHQPHCGRCSQCIDRRFATAAAGLEEHDLPSRYEVDIFKDPLNKGTHRMEAEHYVRFARRLEEMSTPELFVQGFSELYDVLNVLGDPNRALVELHGVFQRHQSAVNRVLERQIEQNAAALRQGTLSPDCLLRAVCAGDLDDGPGAGGLPAPDVVANLAFAGSVSPVQGRVGGPVRPAVDGRRRRRPGRPSDTDHAADARVFGAWGTGQYNSYEDLARELGLTRGDVARAIDRARKRRKN